MYHLAQINIARAIAPLDSPQLTDFMVNLDRINQLAEQSPGFVWRLQSDEGDATSFTIFDDKTIPNLTVWKNIESLHHYVYKTDHIHIMKRRKEWFEPMQEAFLALWWIPAGHIPSLYEAQLKLETLRKKGPTPDAFTFRKHFPAPDQVSEVGGKTLDGHCPA